MANFLSRLASRAAGLAPVAQPVIPSVFSPGLGLDGNRRTPEFAVETMFDPSERSIRSEATREATLPRESGTVPHDVPAPSFSDSSSTGSTREKKSSDPHSAPSTETLPTYSAVSPVTFRPVENAHSSEIDTGAPDDIPRRPIEGYPTEVGGDFPKAAPFRILGKPLLGSELPDETGPVVENNAIPGRRSAPFKLASTIPTNGKTMPSRRDRADGVERESPIIRVTIGRIDVRAQFPAATPPAASTRHPRPATLSLDEYLKQRSEGKR